MMCKLTTPENQQCNENHKGELKRVVLLKGRYGMKTLILGHVGMGLHALIQHELNTPKLHPKCLSIDDVSKLHGEYSNRKQRPFTLSEDVRKAYEEHLLQAPINKLPPIKTIKLSDIKPFSPTNPYLRKSSLSGKIKFKRSIK